MKKSNLALGLGSASALVLAAASMTVSAQVDPNCNKTCGCGLLIESSTTRSGCGDDCYVVNCYFHLKNCGYSDNHNDNCAGYVACVNFQGPNCETSS